MALGDRFGGKQNEAVGCVGAETEPMGDRLKVSIRDVAVLAPVSAFTMSQKERRVHGAVAVAGADVAVSAVAGAGTGAAAKSWGYADAGRGREGERNGRESGWR